MSKSTKSASSKSNATLTVATLKEGTSYHVIANKGKVRRIVEVSYLGSADDSTLLFCDLASGVDHYLRKLDALVSLVVHATQDAAADLLASWENGVAQAWDNTYLRGTDPKATPASKAPAGEASKAPSKAPSAAPSAAPVKGTATRKGATRRASKASKAPASKAPAGEASKAPSKAPTMTPEARARAEQKAASLISNA